MLAHRLRRWPNIETTLCERPAFAWLCDVGYYSARYLLVLDHGIFITPSLGVNSAVVIFIKRVSPKTPPFLTTAFLDTITLSITKEGKRVLQTTIKTTHNTLSSLAM